MEQYIALLRGVNVGGKNMISMPALRESLTRRGLAGVRTYINSGNVLFGSDRDEAVLKTLIEHVIQEDFGLEVPVVVISSCDLAETLANAPDWWGADPGAKHNAMFVIPPADAKTLIETVGAADPAIERVTYYGKVIFWSAALATFSRSRWAKTVGTPVYGSLTIRNANTARKLGHM